MRSTFLLRDDSLSAVLMREKADSQLVPRIDTQAASTHGLDYLPIFKDAEDRLLNTRFFTVDDSCALIHGPWRNHLQTKIKKNNEKPRWALN